jgi:hypothetical protein
MIFSGFQVIKFLKVISLLDLVNTESSMLARTRDFKFGGRKEIVNLKLTYFLLLKLLINSLTVVN